MYFFFQVYSVLTWYMQIYELMTTIKLITKSIFLMVQTFCQFFQLKRSSTDLPYTANNKSHISLSPLGACTRGPTVLFTFVHIVTLWNWCNVKEKKIQVYSSARITNKLKGREMMDKKEQRKTRSNNVLL